MSELLNHIRTRPRGEWTQLLRNELPALAAGIVKELRDSIPGISTHVADIDDEVVNQHMESALLTALGNHEPLAAGHGEGSPRGRDAHDSGPVPSLSAIPSQRSNARPEWARRELFTALTSDTPPSEQALAELAGTARWPLPDFVRAIALTSPGEAQQLAARMDGALAGMVGGQPCLLLPTPDPEARTELAKTLHGRFAAVGHPVPPRDTASSQRWASRLLNLIPTQSAPDVRAAFVDDHLSALMLLQDEHLAHALAARRLRPLADLTPRQSERLEDTLLAWLEGGGAPEAAKALSVHPQTVRYRMRQLEKLFGSDLRDPRTRFELEMALHARRLMAQVQLQQSRMPRRTRAATAELQPPQDAARMARVNGL
ncbi:PucR family transcriptional regulator [Streptomyces erythrochromogenes]|uniref:PucR family transcriptional regulator n=1 Tax=Streptomyces erythrochromogenes TaxID=285574 RepID=UPI0038209EB0|nr:helix-turn-helix domain-containing protein [Streptomyces erythrochromogenes]